MSNFNPGDKVRRLYTSLTYTIESGPFPDAFGYGDVYFVTDSSGASGHVPADRLTLAEARTRPYFEN